MSKNVIEIQGFDALRKKLEQIGNAREARKHILPVFRAASRPLIQAARAKAPTSPAPHHRYSAGKIIATYYPGNLSKSIGNITGRDKNNAVLFVGPRAGKNRKYDGWYGHLVEYGTVHAPAQPFMRPAYEQTKGQVTPDVEARVARKIQQQIDKLSR